MSSESPSRLEQAVARTESPGSAAGRDKPVPYGRRSLRVFGAGPKAETRIEGNPI